MQPHDHHSHLWSGDAGPFIRDRSFTPKRQSGPHYLSAKALRQRLVKESGLFDFRLLCQKASPGGAAIHLGDIALTKGLAWSLDDSAKSRLSSLASPIDLGQPDRLIAELHSTPLFASCDLTADEPAVAVNDGDWICTQCGIVSSTDGHWSSPPEPNPCCATNTPTALTEQALIGQGMKTKCAAFRKHGQPYGLVKTRDVQ